MPSEYISIRLRTSTDKTITDFDIYRLKHIESFKPITCVQGTKGFDGYYAYLFESFCVLESAKYGNATYIIGIDNWELLSQKTKTELLNADEVIKKIIHTANWKNSFTKFIREFG